MGADNGVLPIFIQIECLARVPNSRSQTEMKFAVFSLGDDGKADIWHDTEARSQK